MYYLSDFDGCVGRPASQKQIKEEKLKWLFNLLYEAGEMARADLARVTGLSPTTISALVDELIRKGLVVEAGFASTVQGGRKPINLRVNAQGRQIPTFTLHRWGLRFELYNLGMEVIEAFEVRFSPEEQAQVEESCIAQIQRVLFRQSTRFDWRIAAGVCICVPGIYQPDCRAFVLWADEAQLRLDRLQTLEQELQLPLFIGNESQCLAYAEVQIGKSECAWNDSLLYVIVSEQVESCLYVNNDIYTGRDNYAGRLGHISINYKGKLCSCGGRGCLERYVNIHAILERIAQAAAFSRCPALDRLTGGDMHHLTLQMIGRSYDAGEPAVQEAMDDVAEQLFTGIYALVCATGVGRIVLGGDIVQLGAGFLERLRAFCGRVKGSHLMQGITVDYSRVGLEDCSSGMVRYFINRRLEIGRG